jgi:hypothetical protein
MPLSVRNSRSRRDLWLGKPMVGFAVEFRPAVRLRQARCDDEDDANLNVTAAQPSTMTRDRFEMTFPSARISSSMAAQRAYFNPRAAHRTAKPPLAAAREAPAPAFVVALKLGSVRRHFKILHGECIPPNRSYLVSLIQLSQSAFEHKF